MEWQWILLIILGSLIVLILGGLPVAFCFIVVNIIGSFFFRGGIPGLRQLIYSIQGSVSIFALLPLPLFILMGEILSHSGIAPRLINALDKWLGRIPGRLSLLSVAAGVVIATLSGASMASVAMLGSTLVPEMKERGYKNPMTLGPILGSGGLAIMIPPSGVAIVLGAIGQINIGELLIAIIVPGILMAVLFSLYIIIRSSLQPSLAPSYELTNVSLSEKLTATCQYILPVGFVIFMVIGLIFIGAATPSEAAATGVISCLIITALYKRLNLKVLRGSLTSTMGMTVMIFMIIGGAKAFSEILAFSGAASEVTNLVMGLSISPIFTIVLMQIIVLFLGCWLEPSSIMMITLPLFMPIVHSLGFSPIWFGTLFMINMQISFITPPFGTELFIMKGVAPEGTTMRDIIIAVLPFLALELIALILILLFPQIALWLPGLM